jgi:signal transduction histidine kinase
MKSLSARLTVWYGLVVLLTVVGLLFTGRFYLEHNLVSGIDLLNEVEFQEIRARIDNEDSGESQNALIDAIKEHAELDAALYFFQVGRGHEDILYRSSNLGPHELPRAVHGHPSITVYDDELGWVRSMETKYAGLDIHVVSSLNSAEALFDDYDRASVFVGFGVFLLSLLIGYFLSRLAIRPIAAIQKSAQMVTASRFGERIPVPDTGDEIERMAVLLNAMLDRLEAAYQQVKRFTAEASHEFRTPISIIRLHTERLIEHPELSEIERSNSLSEQMEEIERLNKMIDDLLFLAKADAGVLPLSFQVVDLVEYISDLQSDAVILLGEYSIRFEVSSMPHGEWVMDPRWIRQVLLNLVSNALSASSPGATVQLAVSIEGSWLYLRVIDEGLGLKVDQLVRIFNRFERIESPLNVKGNGLGLAICRSIVERHKGGICAYNRTDRKGLVVEVRLPMNVVNSASV